MDKEHDKITLRLTHIGLSLQKAVELAVSQYGSLDGLILNA